VLPASEWRGVWDAKYYVILNVAEGGNLGGDVDFGPNDYAGITVDYVRHYTWNDKPNFPAPGVTYKIKSQWDNYVLTAKDGDGDQTHVTVAVDNDGPAQKWQFINAGDGRYYIKSPWSGKVIDMRDDSGSSADPPYNITASPNDQRNAQKFDVNVNAEGKVTFHCVNGENLAAMTAAGNKNLEFRRAAGYTPNTAAQVQKWIVSESF